MKHGDELWPKHLDYSVLGSHSAEFSCDTCMQGITVAESIRRYLYGSLDMYDIFMTISTRGGPREPQVVSFTDALLMLYSSLFDALLSLRASGWRYFSVRKLEADQPEGVCSGA